MPCSSLPGTFNLRTRLPKHRIICHEVRRRSQAAIVVARDQSRRRAFTLILYIVLRVENSLSYAESVLAATPPAEISWITAAAG